MKILILNGPNINMIGIRETNVYGVMTYQNVVKTLEDAAKERNLEVIIQQSNHEGVLVDKIQQAYFDQIDGVIINPAAYTHTSVAILDAIKAIAPIPVVEVHFSDIHSRETFRHHSYAAMGCVAQIAGEGVQSYVKAMDYLIQILADKN